ncbi:HEAT repeat domain-containing protein [Thermogemmatispora sp.]|uniref:HEAT repeat domain-containing protein n=1 Tax=Thermogemmatispora sp. TaxID=1968838 RepID=UPI0035E40B6D
MLLSFASWLPSLSFAGWWTLAIPLTIGLAVFVITGLLRRPLALRAYARAVRSSSADSLAVLPLSTASDIYETALAYYQDITDQSALPYKQDLSFSALLQEPSAQLLLLGTSGAGKTFALSMLQRSALDAFFQNRGKSPKLPVYLSLEHYSLYLNRRSSIVVGAEEESLGSRQGTDKGEDESQAGREVASQGSAIANLRPEATLFDFLLESQAAGLPHLRPYLSQLAERGQLLLLCDDLHLIEAAFREAIVAELSYLMSQTGNRLVVSACDLSYEALPQLERLLTEGGMACAVLAPLSPALIRRFVERALREQQSGSRRRYTAGQIIRALEDSRLRYLCSVPLTLFSFLEVLDSLDLANPGQFDSRGRLFERLLHRLLARELRQKRWRRSKGGLREEELVTLLRQLAWTLYQSGGRDLIVWPSAQGRRQRTRTRAAALALPRWFEENGAMLSGQGLVLPADLQAPLAEPSHLERQLACLENAGLVALSGDGLRFRHLWLVEYLVASVLREVDQEADQGLEGRQAALALCCGDAARWAGPVAMWAGLVDEPLALAERFAGLGEAHASLAGPASALALICVGVAWCPPRSMADEPLSLPPRLLRLLSTVLRDPAEVEQLSRLIGRLAAEGTLEVYQGLLPTVMVPGVENLLRLCDQKLLLDRLFDYLYEVIDLPAYDAQVRRLIPVLGRLGEGVIPYAAELVQPAADHSLRLRAAAVRILARSDAQQAVDPLLDCLGDSEQVIVDGALKALVRLGPARALGPLLDALEHYLPGMAGARQVLRAVLVVLDYFLNETDPQRALCEEDRRRILSAVSPLLSGQQPPEVQRGARELLARQLRRQPQPENVQLLIQALASADDLLVRNAIRVLQQGDARLTPLLIEQLESQSAEVVRARLVEVLGGIRDLQALPVLLKLLADPSPLVRQQAGIALQHAYVPESIPGLIELVLQSKEEQVAELAARILSGMGEEVVEPILQALPQIVPGRTQLLIRVLEELDDPRVIPALVDLLKEARAEPLLVVALIRALSRFADAQVVPPLIGLLDSKETLVYEEAILALSRLREVALSDLLDALDVEPERETVVAARARRAILGMEPFPGEQLIAVLTHGSEAQVSQVARIFQERGAEAALLLVHQLFHPDARTRGYVRQILDGMAGQILVPALLEVLNRPAWRPVLAEYLVRYPAEAVPPLIALLGDPERGDAAVSVLLLFGPSILSAIVPGLAQEDELARRRAQQLVISLVRQQPETVEQVVQLFGPSLPSRAYESLVEILAGDLADLAVPALLAGLGDAYLLAGVSEVLARLARRRLTPAGREALAGLVAALRSDEQRHGAEITLVELGELAVASVGELITDPDPQVARAARRILRDIGTPALPFIWAACSDLANRQRREAALEIFRSMPTLVIKDELLAHLASRSVQESSMAATLLQERIYDEANSPDPSRQEMVPALLEYVQHPQSDERLCRRILALLLLMGGEYIVQHLVQALYERPERQELLMRCFLFLGREGEAALWEMYHDPETPPDLANQVVSVLGMLRAYPEICDLALSLSQYGLTLNKERLQSPDQLEISLRALGGLLAGGHWNVEALEDLRQRLNEGTAERDLVEVLLGWRYGSYITRLENDLQSVEQAHKENMRNLTMQLLQARSQLSDMEHERENLEESLKKAQQELEIARQELARLTQEHQRLQQEQGTRSEELEQAQQAVQRLQERLNVVVQEKRLLQDQINQLHAHNAQLVEQINLLQGAENP